MKTLSKSRSNLETTATRHPHTDRLMQDLSEMPKNMPKYAIKLMNYIQPSLKNLKYSQDCRIIKSRKSHTSSTSRQLYITSTERFISPKKLPEPDIEFIQQNPAKPTIPYLSISDGNLIDLKPAGFTQHETSNIKVNEAIDGITNYNKYHRKPRRNYQECFKRSMSELKQLNINPSNTAIFDKLISKQPYDKEGSKIFLKACKSGNELSVISILYENRYIINCYDFTGMSGLHWATIRNHIKIVKILLRYKTILDAVDYVISTIAS